MKIEALKIILALRRTTLKQTGSVVSCGSGLRFEVHLHFPYGYSF